MATHREAKHTHREWKGGSKWPRRGKNRQTQFSSIAWCSVRAPSSPTSPSSCAPWIRFSFFCFYFFRLLSSLILSISIQLDMWVCMCVMRPSTTTLISLSFLFLSFDKQRKKFTIPFVGLLSWPSRFFPFFSCAVVHFRKAKLYYTRLQGNSCVLRNVVNKKARVSKLFPSPRALSRWHILIHKNESAITFGS